MIAIFFASFIGLSVAASRLTRRSIEEMPLVVCSVLIITLYGAALAGVLVPAAYALSAIGCAALMWSLASPARRREAFTLERPAFVILIVAAFLLWLKVRTTSYHAWDEFSHWGLVVKEMAYVRRLPGIDSPTMFNYPPGAALFQYFVTVHVGLSEGATIFAQDFLILCALSVLFQRVRWTDRRPLAALAICVALLPFILGPGLRVVVMDHLLGLWFGAVVASYFLSGATRGSALVAVPACSALALLKEVGLFLAAIAALIIVIDQFIQRTPRRTLSAGALLMLFAGPVALDQSWKANLQHEHFVNTNTRTIPILTVLHDLLYGNATYTEAQQLTIANFRHALTTIGVGTPGIGDIFIHDFRGLLRAGAAYVHPDTVSAPSLMAWLLIFAVMTGAAMFIQSTGTNRIRIGLVAVLLVVGAGLYVLGVLRLYLVYFSDYEATRLASFSRYLTTYVAGAVLAMLSLIVSGLREGSRPLATRVLAVVAVLCVLGAPLTSAAFYLRGTPPMSPQRRAVRDITSKVAGHLSPEKRTYFIWQNTAGYEYVLARYELYPVQLRNECWSVGPPHDAADVWTCNITQAQFEERLRKYDVLFVAYADPGFWRRYAGLFADPAAAPRSHLFDIDRSGAHVVFRATPES